jgi:hypothetical protein
MIEFRESINIVNILCRVKRLDYVRTGNVSQRALEAIEEERNITILRRRKSVSFGSRLLRKTIILNKEHNKRGGQIKTSRTGSASH